ncbi:RAMP superfamily CRISPR-associated protein [Scytonema sp. NUACC21]
MKNTQALFAIKNDLIRKQRYIIKRVIIRSTLILDTPTSLGNGDAESPIHLALVRDSISEHALLTGSSIAGAIRNYLREYENGYMASEKADDLATILFGAIRSDEDGNQSPLIIDDSISTSPIKFELRDGVEINSVTRTAADKAKYDLELLQTGTEFPLCFELLIERESDEPALLKGLAIALQGLEKGEISVGMKKRRGFGRCHVKEWQVWNFHMEDASDRMAWLTLDHSWLTEPPCTKLPAVNTSIIEAMKEVGLKFVEEFKDRRVRFTIQATFKLTSSLLIRSSQFETSRDPEFVHLKSHRPNPQSANQPNAVPVLSGTSLAGVLRHRAERIVNTLHEVNSQITQEIVNDIFGFPKGKKDINQPDSNSRKKKLEAKASRLVVHESIIKHTTDLVQSRIAIDRFTGGVYHGALFQEQPVLGGSNENLKLHLELCDPKDHEIGLLLLLLKDLWTEDLPVGGASSVGRGRLQGICANMTYYKSGKTQEWMIQEQPDKTLHISHPKKLEAMVEAFLRYSPSNSTSESKKKVVA